MRLGQKLLFPTRIQIMQNDCVSIDKVNAFTVGRPLTNLNPGVGPFGDQPGFPGLGIDKI